MGLRLASVVAAGRSGAQPCPAAGPYPQMRRLIADMESANPSWGAPRTQAELQKLAMRSPSARCRDC